MNEVPNKWIPSVDVRRYIYRVFAALLPVAGFYGWLGPEELPLYLQLGSVILGVGGGAAAAIAAVNTPTKEATADDGETLEDIFKPSDEVNG